MALDTLGNGLVLLSKWPLSDVYFERFPTYDYSALPGDHDSWANKGVLTATVTVDTLPQPRQFRIGMSHALTGGDDQKGQMSRHYVDITPFELDGHSYIFGLHVDVGANIWRIDDYGTSQSPEHPLVYGAGKQLVYYGGSMSPNYRFVNSFQLNGHPYIFALHNDVGANIWRINDDPSTGFTLVKYGASMSANYVAVVTFHLNGHPYLFGLHKDVGANIWRINDNPATGFTLVKYGASMSSNYVAVIPFELNGHPYMFGLHNSAGPMIWRINDDPSTGMTQMCYNCSGGPKSTAYHIMASFQLDNHPYIFGLHENGYASIWRINNNPASGMTLVVDRDSWSSNYRFIKSLNVKGHPYLFGLKNCCDQYLDPCLRSRPGEAYITRISDTPVDGAGWQHTYQMEDMRIIAEQTVTRPDLPAIMAGDFNVHLARYGIMDTIFRQAGAVDAYVKANGTADGSETIDLLDNSLDQLFASKDPTNPDHYPKESTFDRLDYVYVKQTGQGFRLVPTKAFVVRDWTYDDTDDSVPDRDLSDHYPVLVEFKLSHQPDLN